MLKPRLCCLLIATVTMALLVGGCWDRREIDIRGFVLTVAVDLPPPEKPPAAPEEKEYVPQSAGKKKYAVTYEVANLKALQKGEASSGGKENKQTYLYTTEGQSLLETVRKVNAQSDQALFFEHMQALLLGEGLVRRENLAELLDFFLRDPEMRRRTDVFIARPDAGAILTAELTTPEPRGLLLSGTMLNAKKSPHFASKVDLGDISEQLHTGQAFALPIVYADKGELVLAGSALFRHGRMVGELTEEETVGGKVLRNNLKQGVTAAPCPAHPDKLVVFELFDSRVKIRCLVTDIGPRFTVNATFKGNLAENTCKECDPLDPAFLRQAEQAVADVYTRQINSALAKMQAVNADTPGFGDLLRRTRPQYWAQIAGQWDEMFPTVPVDVRVKVKITRPGIIRN